MKAEMSLVGLLIVVLWGFWGFLYKYGVAKVGLLQALLVTNIFYSITNIVIIIFLIHRGVNIPRDTSLVVLGLGTLFGTIGSIGFLYALERFPGSVVIPFTALYPAVSSILAVLILQERMESNTVIGIILAVIAGYFLTR